MSLEKLDWLREKKKHEISNTGKDMKSNPGSFIIPEKGGSGSQTLRVSRALQEVGGSRESQNQGC